MCIYVGGRYTITLVKVDLSLDEISVYVTPIQMWEMAGLASFIAGRLMPNPIGKKWLPLTWSKILQMNWALGSH